MGWFCKFETVSVSGTIFFSPAIKSVKTTHGSISFACSLYIPRYVVNYSPCSASRIASVWSQVANNMQIPPRCNFAPASFSAILGKLEVGPKLRLACWCMLVCFAKLGLAETSAQAAPGISGQLPPLGRRAGRKPCKSQK